MFCFESVRKVCESGWVCLCAPVYGYTKAVL